MSDGGGLAGSLSNCVGGKGGHGDDYKGFLKDGNELLEVMPLRDRWNTSSNKCPEQMCTTVDSALETPSTVY